MDSNTSVSCERNKEESAYKRKKKPEEASSIESDGMESSGLSSDDEEWEVVSEKSGQFYSALNSGLEFLLDAAKVLARSGEEAEDGGPQQRPMLPMHGTKQSKESSSDDEDWAWLIRKLKEFNSAVRSDAGLAAKGLLWMLGMLAAADTDHEAAETTPVNTVLMGAVEALAVFYLLKSYWQPAAVSAATEVQQTLEAGIEGIAEELLTFRKNFKKSWRPEAVGLDRIYGLPDQRRRILESVLTQQPEAAALTDEFPEIKDEVLTLLQARFEGKSLSEIFERTQNIASIWGAQPTVERMTYAAYGWFVAPEDLPKTFPAMFTAISPESIASLRKEILIRLLDAKLPKPLLQKLVEHLENTPFAILHDAAMQINASIGDDVSTESIHLAVVQWLKKWTDIGPAMLDDRLRPELFHYIRFLVDSGWSTTGRQMLRAGSSTESGTRRGQLPRQGFRLPDSGKWWAQNVSAPPERKAGQLEAPGSSEAVRSVNFFSNASTAYANASVPESLFSGRQADPANASARSAGKSTSKGRRPRAQEMAVMVSAAGMSAAAAGRAMSHGTAAGAVAEVVKPLLNARSDAPAAVSATRRGGGIAETFKKNKWLGIGTAATAFVTLVGWKIWDKLANAGSGPVGPSENMRHENFSVSGNTTTESPGQADITSPAVQSDATHAVGYSDNNATQVTPHLNRTHNRSDDSGVSPASEEKGAQSTKPSASSASDGDTTSQPTTPARRDADHDSMLGDEPASPELAAYAAIKYKDIDQLNEQSYRFYTVEDENTRLRIGTLSHGIGLHLFFLKRDGNSGIDLFESGLDLTLNFLRKDKDKKTRTSYFGDDKKHIHLFVTEPLDSARVSMDIERQISVMKQNPLPIQTHSVLGKHTADGGYFQYGTYILQPNQTAHILSIDERFPLQIWLPKSNNDTDRKLDLSACPERFYSRTGRNYGEEFVKNYYFDKFGNVRMTLAGYWKTVRVLNEQIPVFQPESMQSKQNRFLNESANDLIRPVYDLMNDKVEQWERRIYVDHADDILKSKVKMNEKRAEYYSLKKERITKIETPLKEYWNDEKNVNGLEERIRNHYLTSINHKVSGLTKEGAELSKLVFFKSMGRNYTSLLTQSGKSPVDLAEVKNNVRRFDDIAVSRLAVYGRVFDDMLRIDDKKNGIILLYLVGAEHPFFEFQGQAEMNQWVSQLIKDRYGRAALGQHVPLSNRSDAILGSGLMRRGFEYWLEHSDQNSQFFEGAGGSPNLADNFFKDLASSAKLRQINDFDFIKNRTGTVLNDFYDGKYAPRKEPGSMEMAALNSKEMADLNYKMVEMVNRKYAPNVNQSVKNDSYLDYKERELRWFIAIEDACNLEYAHISEAAVEMALNETGPYKGEPDIISIVKRANEIDKNNQWRAQIKKISEGRKNKTLDFSYSETVRLVHNTLGEGAEPGYTERSVIVEQDRVLTDIQMLTKSDPAGRYKLFANMSWVLAAMAFGEKIGSDYVYSSQHIIQIAAKAEAIDPYVRTFIRGLSELDESRLNQKFNVLMTAIMQLLGVEKEWKSKVDDIYPVVHTQFVPTVPLDESKEALRRQQEASRLEARVIESAKVISEADERHFRLAKEYIKNIFPDMAKSYRDFKWQIEFARVLEEIAKLQDRDFYSAINKEGIHQATTVLLKDKEYKGYQPPSVQDFLELALNKTLVHAFDGIYKKGKPYWSKTPDGTEIDPTGTVKKVPIDIMPSIRTDYSGYDVKEFLYQLQKALENPPGDTAAQLMRVHGKWTEDDIVMAKQIGAFVVRAFESLGYIPIIGTPAAVAMVARPIASGMVNFIQRRVNEGGTFGKEDVKDLAGVAWTAVGLRIPAKPAKKAIPFIVGHVAVGEGIARI